MAIDAYEEMSLPHSPERVGQQRSSKRSGQWDGSKKSTYPTWPAKRSGFDSAQDMSVGQLAAGTAKLQRLLADTYPELARIQRLEGLIGEKGA